MASVNLNKTALNYAKRLISEDNYVIDDRDAWSEHQPSADQENRYIQEHGLRQYARWYLGVDTGESEDAKARYKFPYGDFRNIHRCGVLSAESRAGQYKHRDIEQAAAHLHGMLDALK